MIGMIIPNDPKVLAKQLVQRSSCRVQMSAVLHDSHGIFAWGWNNAGAEGLGEHAECCAIRRANPGRRRGSHVTVAGIRRKSQRPVISLPCMDCMAALRTAKVKWVTYHDKHGRWQTIDIT